MDSHTLLEIDVATGLVVERNYNAEELAQRAIDDERTAMAEQSATDKAAADAAARAAAVAHAKTLGFTDQMIAVMYPTLVEA